MVDPTTVNIALAVPTRGSDVGTWDVPVNGDFSSLDGHLGGVVTVGLTNAPVTLTAPAGSITPSPGPTQAENAVVRLTGTLTGDVQVTLPLPGPIIIENLTTGNFVVTFRAVGSGEIIATQQGTRTSIYNDGSNVRFVDLGKPGDMEFWAGLSALPAWVAACTVKPFLLCDSSVYNYSDYPYLGPRMGGAFGGNGITTFGVPGLGGAVPLAYDYTGTRITTAGSGIDGQQIGAFGGVQSFNIAQNQLPNIAPTFTGTAGTVTVNSTQSAPYPATGSTAGDAGLIRTGANTQPITSTGTFTPQGTVASINGNVAQQLSRIIQPSQVAGIWVIKT